MWRILVKKRKKNIVSNSISFTEILRFQQCNVRVHLFFAHFQETLLEQALNLLGGSYGISHLSQKTRKQLIFELVQKSIRLEDLSSSFILAISSKINEKDKTNGILKIQNHFGGPSHSKISKEEKPKGQNKPQIDLANFQTIWNAAKAISSILFPGDFGKLMEFVFDSIKPDGRAQIKIFVEGIINALHENVRRQFREQVVEYMDGLCEKLLINEQTYMVGFNLIAAVVNSKNEVGLEVKISSQDRVLKFSWLRAHITVDQAGFISAQFLSGRKKFNDFKLATTEILQSFTQEDKPLLPESGFWTKVEFSIEKISKKDAQIRYRKLLESQGRLTTKEEVAKLYEGFDPNSYANDS